MEELLSVNICNVTHKCDERLEYETCTCSLCIRFE